MMLKSRQKLTILMALAIILQSQSSVIAKVQSNAQVLPDPTKPIVQPDNSDQGEGLSLSAVASSVSFPSLSVTAVFIAAGQRYAMVNGSPWHQGQLRKDIRLQSIVKDKVIFVRAGERKIVKLNNMLVISEYNNEF